MASGVWCLFSACHWCVEEEISWNSWGCFDYLEFALSSKILDDFKPSAGGNFWLALSVGSVGQNNFKKVEVMLLSAAQCQKWSHLRGISHFFFQDENSSRWWTYIHNICLVYFKWKCGDKFSQMLLKILLFLPITVMLLGFGQRHFVLGFNFLTLHL